MKNCSTDGQMEASQGLGSGSTVCRSECETNVIVDCPQKSITNMETYVTFRVSVTTTRTDLKAALVAVDDLEIRRRFNDFIYLRVQLEVLHPTRIVPPLPEKHPLHSIDRFSGPFIDRRTKALQRFLQRLAEHPVLSTASVFTHFLSDKNAHWED